MTLRNKTPEQRFEQIKRIMRKLEKRGQNNEKINDEYKKILKNSIN
jgi:hypothetical protein